MQPNIPRETRNQGHQRERPLQKSMFLPDTYSQQNMMPPLPIRQQQHMDYIPYNPLKKSSTTPMQNISQPILNSSYSYNSPSYNQPLYMNQNPIQQFTIQQRSQSQHEALYHSNSSNSLKNQNNMSRSEIIADIDAKGFNKIQKQPAFQGKVSQVQLSVDTVDSQKIINDIVLQIKEKHLPMLINSVKKQLYDDLHNFRVQFQTLKEEMKQYMVKQESFNTEIKGQMNSIISLTSNTLINSGGKTRKEKDPQFVAMENRIALMEGKFGQIDVKINDNYAKFQNELQKWNGKVQTEFNQKTMKSGFIKSSLPPILLQYKQIFIIKKQNSSQNSPQKNYNQQEIVFSSFTYHIDRQGHLLDNQNRYIVDGKGHQIRLEEKHLKILQQLKIFQK